MINWFWYGATIILGVVFLLQPSGAKKALWAGAVIISLGLTVC